MKAPYCKIMCFSSLMKAEHTHLP
uniref:Uncharacterized protein n=1 Tax=Anguilla anguilla TaxID=7936 RepID=A0A0E9RUV9_ANGAN